MPATHPSITRIEPLGPKSLRVRIQLDEGDAVEVALEAVERCKLGVGDALTPGERTRLDEADAEVRVRDAALSLLSYRARTRRELGTKLRQKGFEAEQIDGCLDRLQERGLLDDEAVAAAFIRDRLRHRPRGKARLASELRAKGVDVDTAFETIDTVFEDEGASDLQLALETAEGWLNRQGDGAVQALAGDHSAERQKARRRLHGYLARRGFRGQAATRAMEHAAAVAQERVG